MNIVKIKRPEIFRKLLHLSSIIYPVLYSVALDKKNIVLLLGALLILMITLEILRFHYLAANQIFCRYCNFLLRHNEKKHITGATYFLCGSLITVLFFEKDIAITSLCVLVISDTFAAIVGLTLGKFKLYDNKTLEGSAAFCGSALVIAWIASNITYLSLQSLILAAIATTIIELFSKKLKLDDNILIPISFAIFYTTIS